MTATFVNNVRSLDLEGAFRYDERELGPKSAIVALGAILGGLFVSTWEHQTANGAAK